MGHIGRIGSYWGRIEAYWGVLGRICKIGRNHSASMNKYLNDNLILGDSLEFFGGDELH